MSKIPEWCIINGEGVVVWDARLPQDRPLGVFESDEETLMSDAQTYETVKLYRPVTVDVVDEEAVAYFYRSEAARRIDKRGKVYVNPKYVYMRPPSNAHRARRFGCVGPCDEIKPDDVPDKFAEGDGA